MAFDHARLLTLPEARAAYSDRAAYVMAECSQLAYRKFEEGGSEEQQLRDDLAKCGFELVRGFSSDNTQAFLAKGPTFAVLAFRGTEKNFGDIWTDLKARFYRTPAGRIHRGFGSAYGVVADDVARAVQELTVPVYITGHSLGGALATIASLVIRPSDRIAACYTFGSPRVGDAEFEEGLYKVPVYRVVHAADIVPRVPLMAMGYRHTGDLRYITRTAEVLRNPAQLRLLFRFVYSVLRRWWTLFEDHRIAGYIETLAGWAERRQ